MNDFGKNHHQIKTTNTKQISLEHSQRICTIK